MCVFTKARKSPNTLRRALLFIDNRHFIGFIQRQLSSNYRHKPIVTYWALKKCKALITI